jgi:hypothetical protein
MHQHSIHIAKQMHVCKPKYKTLLNQPMPDDQFLSSHLFGCLVRDLNYGPWLVTTLYTLRLQKIPEVDHLHISLDLLHSPVRVLPCIPSSHIVILCH